MHHHRPVFAAIAVAIAAAASPAAAATLFQSLPDLTVAPTVAGYCSSCNAFLPFRIYDSFTLAADATITTVTFALDNFYPGNSVNIGFFNLAGALPGTAIADYTFTPAQFVSFDPIAAFGERDGRLVTVDIGALMLAAGSYDISFFNANGLSIPAYANPGGTLYQSGNFFQASQFHPGQSAAFALYGTNAAAVPEPASWALMITGFGMAGASLRRRRTALIA
jgi:hypothetical protein